MAFSMSLCIQCFTFYNNPLCAPILWAMWQVLCVSVFASVWRCVCVCSYVYVHSKTLGSLSGGWAAMLPQPAFHVLVSLCPSTEWWWVSGRVGGESASALLPDPGEGPCDVRRTGTDRRTEAYPIHTFGSHSMLGMGLRQR